MSRTRRLAVRLAVVGFLLALAWLGVLVVSQRPETKATVDEVRPDGVACVGEGYDSRWIGCIPTASGVAVEVGDCVVVKFSFWSKDATIVRVSDCKPT